MGGRGRQIQLIVKDASVVRMGSRHPHPLLQRSVKKETETQDTVGIYQNFEKKPGVSGDDLAGKGMPMPSKKAPPLPHQHGALSPHTVERTYRGGPSAGRDPAGQDHPLGLRAETRVGSSYVSAETGTYGKIWDPEAPFALGTFRTAVTAETACCERSAGSQPEAWSPFLWGLGCPAWAAVYTSAGLSPSCVYRWVEEGTHTASLAPPPLCGDENPTLPLSLWEPPHDRVGSF